MAESVVASIEVSEHEYLRLSAFERFDDGSGFKCRLDVQCGDFGCSRRSFYFDDLPLVVERLEKAHDSLQGEVGLRQRYEREFITFSTTPIGHFVIKGELTDYRDCELRFSLNVDQTYLKPFIRALRDICVQLRA